MSNTHDNHAARKPTLEELSLHQIAQRYQFKYFRDVTLKDLRIVKQLGTIKYEDGTTELADIQSQNGLDIVFWKVCVAELQDAAGRCEPETRTIFIQERLQGDGLKSVLLHEMLHAFESELWPSHRDWLLLWLERMLARKLSERKLRKLIDSCLWSPIKQPAHSVFFLFKSLDLDIRCGWKLGFTFGYGREEMYANKKPRNDN